MAVLLGQYVGAICLPAACCQPISVPCLRAERGCDNIRSPQCLAAAAARAVSNRDLWPEPTFQSQKLWVQWVQAGGWWQKVLLG